MGPLKTKDGKTVHTIKQLISCIKGMNDKNFQKQVNEKTNDFANWVEDECLRVQLAYSLRNNPTKKDMLKILKEFKGTCESIYEVIIVGAGIAGMAAAVYASRKRMRYLVLSDDIGGQISVAGTIENWPGDAKMSFIDFQERMEKQLKHNNIKPHEGEPVEKIAKTKDGHYIVTTKKKSYETKSVIIASGARARELGVPGEEKFKHKGLTYCAVCDGPIFKGRDVAVIGGSNSALEAAEFMLRIAKKIYVVVLDEEMKGHEALKEKVVDQPNVEIITQAKTTKILGDKMVTGIEYEQNKKKKKRKVGGVLVEIGRIPNTGFVKGLVKMDKHGHILVDRFCQTSVSGIYAVGDCSDIHEYQFSISAGMAVTALLHSARNLQKKD